MGGSPPASAVRSLNPMPIDRLRTAAITLSDRPADPYAVTSGGSPNTSCKCGEVVAVSWGLSVDCYSGKPGKALGWYRRKQAIALDVQNLATWAHELVHATDDRQGQFTERGQHWRSETVAELGGRVLECLGPAGNKVGLGTLRLRRCARRLAL